MLMKKGNSFLKLSQIFCKIAGLITETIAQY